MTVKTAISLDDALMAKVDGLARATGLSRSRLFSLAMRGYLEQYENQMMLETLNEVYGELSAEQDAEQEEGALRTQRRSKHRRLVEGTW